MRLSYVTLFARDLDALAGFYVAGLGLDEVVESRSDRYREVRAGAVTIGFVSHDAYRMLDLADEAAPSGLRGIVTFDAGDAAAVAPAAERAVAAGATLVKPGHASTFGTWQIVLRDPEGNAFRISAAAA